MSSYLCTLYYRIVIDRSFCTEVNGGTFLQEVEQGKTVNFSMPFWKTVLGLKEKYGLLFSFGFILA